jgi:hypothetical protein
MKFGNVDNPERIDFTLPPDHVDTKQYYRSLKATIALRFLWVVPSGIGQI